MGDTVTTRFLILSDTHSIDLNEVKTHNGKCHPPFPKTDVVLHCGDLTNVGRLIELKQFVQMMGNFDAELKLVIAGNHDLTLDRDYCRTHTLDGFSEKEHEEAIQIMTGPLAKEAGITYLEEGLHTFSLKNGAKFTIYTSPYTPEFCDWGFPYYRSHDRFSTSEQVDEASASIAVNPLPDRGTVDIVMTHGPPQYVLDACANGNVGCDNLLRAVSRCRPRLHCFGHIHEGHGASKIVWTEDSKIIGRSAMQSTTRQNNSYPEVDKCQVEFGMETLMVNAAIMDVSCKPRNPPWLLDLEMPRSD
jgi:predicted phosphohydrolase